MTDPTEAISEAHRQIVSVIQHMVELKELVPYNLHRAARNLKYALDAMAVAPCNCGVMCQDLGKEAGCRYMQPARETLRKLVDLTYCHALEDQVLPATQVADKLIDGAFGVGTIAPLPEVKADPLREALEPFVTAAKVIAARPQDYDNRIVSIGGLIDACDLTKLHFERLLAALAAPQPPARETISDTRWAVNILLEKIAEKFDGWDTMDMWRSDAAAVVRGFKHDVSAPPPPAPITTEQFAPVGGREAIARIIRKSSTDALYNGAGKVVNPEVFEEAADAILALSPTVTTDRAAVTEVEKSREVQSAQVIPLIGGLLDAWEGLPNDIKSDSGMEWLGKRLTEIDEAMSADMASWPVKVDRAAVIEEMAQHFETSVSVWHKDEVAARLRALVDAKEDER